MSQKNGHSSPENQYFSDIKIKKIGTPGTTQQNPMHGKTIYK